MLGNSVSRATSTSHDFCQFEEKTCGNGHDLKRDNKRIRVDTHSGKVRFLRRLNLDQLNDQGETLLTQAVRDGDMQMAQRLLERGASPYVRNSHGDTAGDIARSLSSLPDASPVPDARSRSLSSWPLFNIASLLRDAQGLSQYSHEHSLSNTTEHDATPSPATLSPSAPSPATLSPCSRQSTSLSS